MHMRRSNYDINGAEQSDYVDRIGGNNALFMCLNVDNQFCLPQLPGFEQLMPTAPGVLDDIDLTRACAERLAAYPCDVTMLLTMALATV